MSITKNPESGRTGIITDLRGLFQIFMILQPYIEEDKMELYSFSHREKHLTIFSKVFLGASEVLKKSTTENFLIERINNYVLCSTQLCSPSKIQDHINQENRRGDGLTIRRGWCGPKWCGWGCWSRTNRGCHQAHFRMTLKEKTGKKEIIQF